MKCPFCGATDQIQVIDSRDTSDGSAIRRRRHCGACERRFTTYERVEELIPAVVKRDGRREPYSREKLLKGVEAACQKRKIPLEQIDNLLDEVERVLIETGEREIDSVRIGEEVMARLKNLDAVAYLRFASVYRSFNDITEFAREVEAIAKKSNERRKPTRDAPDPTTR